MIPYAPLLSAAFGRPAIIGATREPTQTQVDANLLSDARIVCLSQTVWQYQWTGVLLYHAAGRKPLLLLPNRNAADAQHIVELDALWAMPIAESDPQFRWRRRGGIHRGTGIGLASN